MLKPLIFALCAVFTFGRLSAQTPVWQPSAGHTQLPIWPGAVPDAGKQPIDGPEAVRTLVTKDGIRWVAAPNVTQPTMTIYSPKGTNTGVAVVVLPGGGYTSLAMDLEGTEICDWITQEGMTCIVLKYRFRKRGVTARTMSKKRPRCSFPCKTRSVRWGC